MTLFKNIPTRLLCLFFVLPAQPATANSELALLDVARSDTWKKLLHYEADSGAESGLKSVVISPEFFLSPDGDSQPLEELRATLKAFSLPITDDPNAHPQCLFRARYLWLKRRLDFSGLQLPAVDCALYDKWTLDRRTQSISVVFATGYLGNPASYYGHTLLKFNAEGTGKSRDLLDVSVNYGAIVPDAVNPVTYIVNGIIGGYDGGFTHIEYYYHDHNYGDLELRDVWEYELNLEPDDVAMITAHSWELIGKKFKYYFFRRNCAYRMAEVLQIVEGLDVIPANRPWTIPQALIQKLSRATLKGRPLLKSVRYHPSRQTRLYERFSVLDPFERDVSSAIVDDIDELNSEAFDSLPPGSQARVLDTLIDYYQYLRDPEWPDTHPVSRGYRELLQRRFSVDVGETVSEFRQPTAPHQGRSPSVSRIGAFHSSEFGNGVALQVRPAYYDAMDAGPGHVPNASLSMFEADIRLVSGKVFLRSLDFFRIESVNGGYTGYPEDDGKMWKLRLGLEQADLGCRTCLVGRFSGSYGQTWRVAEAIVTGVSVGGGLQNDQSQSGVVYGGLDGFANVRISSRLFVRASYEIRNHFGARRGIDNVASIAARYSLGTGWETRLIYQKHEKEELGIYLGYYW